MCGYSVRVDTCGVGVDALVVAGDDESDEYMFEALKRRQMSSHRRAGSDGSRPGAPAADGFPRTRSFSADNTDDRMPTTGDSML